MFCLEANLCQNLRSCLLQYGGSDFQLHICNWWFWRERKEKNNLLVYFFASYICRPCKWDYQIEHSLQPQAKNRLSCQFWWLHQTWMSQGYWKGETGPSLLCQFCCCCCFWLLFVCCCCCCFGGQGKEGGRGWGSFYLITFNVAHLWHALAR